MQNNQNIFKFAKAQTAIIPGTFWFDWFDGLGEMANIEEENADIAGVTSRLPDEESGHFSPQKPAKIKRTGYKIVMVIFVVFLLLEWL